jgi:hypothetical protein
MQIIVAVQVAGVNSKPDVTKRSDGQPAAFYRTTCKNLSPAIP